LGYGFKIKWLPGFAEALLLTFSDGGQEEMERKQ
jgi:hypothetical protein